MIEKYETLSPQILRMDAHKLKATIAFLPYAVRLGETGTGELPNISSRATGFSQPSHPSDTGFSHWLLDIWEQYFPFRSNTRLWMRFDTGAGSCGMQATSMS